MPASLQQVLKPVRSTLVRWLLLPPPWIKLNTDGSYDRHTGSAFGVGSFGIILAISSKTFHMPLEATSSFDDMLQALLYGLHLTRRFDAPIWIELDVIVVVRLLQMGRLGPW